MGQPKVAGYLIGLHDTYRIAGWPIPTRLWTATHFTLFTLVQEKINELRNTKGRRVVRSDTPGFDAALRSATGGP